MVEANPWLRNQQISSSEVNSLAMECRKAEKPLPASLEALEVFRVEQKTAADEKKSNEMAGLLARLEASERRAMIAEAEANTLHIQLDQARTQAQAQAEQIGALKGVWGAMEPKTNVSTN